MSKEKDKRYYAELAGKLAELIEMFDDMDAPCGGALWHRRTEAKYYCLQLHHLLQRDDPSGWVQDADDRESRKIYVQQQASKMAELMGIPPIIVDLVSHTEGDGECAMRVDGIQEKDGSVNLDSIKMHGEITNQVLLGNRMMFDYHLANMLAIWEWVLSTRDQTAKTLRDGDLKWDKIQIKTRVDKALRSFGHKPEWSGTTILAPEMGD